MASLEKSLDRAIARANKEALADGWVPDIGEPKFPIGTPEYEAYVQALRAALNEWKLEA